VSAPFAATTASTPARVRAMRASGDDTATTSDASRSALRSTAVASRRNVIGSNST
jgi:hypothetical protein